MVTGCSSGIGKVTALRLAEKGWNVFAGVRSSSAADAVASLHPRVLPLFLDVCNQGDVRDAVHAVTTELSANDRSSGRGLDALVNNAGVAITGPLEFAPIEDAQRQFDTNYFGAVRTIQAFLPLLRQGSSPGRIVNVSSVAGDVALPYWAHYCASKFALEGASDSLRLELAPQGIKVSLVKPGPVRTPTFWSRTQEESGALKGKLGGEAKQLYGAQFDKYEAAYIAASVDPSSSCTDEEVAATILRALTDSFPKERYLVGPTTGLLITLKRLLPTAALDGLLLQMPTASKLP